MIAFGTVVYPSALGYLNEFANCINEQTYKSFDLIIVNDNVDDTLLKAHLENVNVNYSIVSVHKKRTPADLRVDLIRQSKLRGYDLLILGDIDDLFDENRVLEIVKFYINDNSFSFYYNELLLFDRTRALKAFPERTESLKNIIQYNYLGLSNNSINLKSITVDFIDSLYGCTSFVFDWYLFSRIICEGGRGVFVENAITYYRIYAGNYAGVSNEEQLKKELEIKIKHYELMRNYNSIYTDLLDKLLIVDVTKIKSSDSPTYWWNNIIL